MTDDRLQLMYDAQVALQLQMKPVGRDPAELEDEDAIQFLKDMKLALEAELQELLDEVGWKPWATSRHINEDAAKGELVDVWHFFLNLMRVLHMTPQELFERYEAKRQVNLARQAGGYDGVSTKCRRCKRALDDEAVECWYNAEDQIGYCAKEEEVLRNYV